MNLIAREVYPKATGGGGVEIKTWGEMSWFRKLKHSFSNQRSRNRTISSQYIEEPEDELNRSQEDDEPRSRNRIIASQCPEEPNRNLYRSRSIYVQRQADDEPYLNRSRSSAVRSLVDDRNPNQNRSNISSRRSDQTRPTRPDQTQTPRDMNELFRIINQMKNRKLPEGYDDDDDDDDDVDLTTREYDDNVFVYIEEALKGAKMNQNWKRKIFSQRLEDDDEELRKEIDKRLKHYDPDIAHQYWDKERYSILERRHYQKDVNTTEGFEVGYYPYLWRNSGSLIIRYYCPPDANLPDDGIAHLYGLANHAIQFYNSTEQTHYIVVKVIKTMTSVAAGTWFYITFQASIPWYGDQLWTFEAKLFEGIPCPERYIKVEFVRLKMEAGSSSLIQEPPYAANLYEPQACCSSSNFFNPFPGQ